MSQQSGLSIANKANFSDVPKPSGNNLSYFLNRNDADRLYAMKSNGSVFPIIPTTYNGGTGVGVVDQLISGVNPLVVAEGTVVQYEINTIAYNVTTGNMLNIKTSMTAQTISGVTTIPVGPTWAVTGDAGMTANLVTNTTINITSPIFKNRLKVFTIGFPY